MSAQTGRREGDARCSKTHAGGIVPFRGRDATWIALSNIPNPRSCAKRITLVPGTLTNTELTGEMLSIPPVGKLPRVGLPPASTPSLTACVSAPRFSRLKTPANTTNSAPCSLRAAAANRHRMVLAGNHGRFRLVARARGQKRAVSSVSFTSACTSLSSCKGARSPPTHQPPVQAKLTAKTATAPAPPPPGYAMSEGAEAQPVSASPTASDTH